MWRTPFSMESSKRCRDRSCSYLEASQEYPGAPCCLSAPGRWRHRAQLSVATMSRLPPSQQAQTKRRDLVTEKTLNGERGGVKARLEQGGRWLPTAGKELGCTMPPYPWGMRVLPRAPHPTVWAFVTLSGISLGVQ